MPYPENHPYRTAFAELHNRITNALFEYEMTDEPDFDYAAAFSVLLYSVDLFAYAIEDLMDQADFDPARVVLRTVDEV